MNDRVFAVIAGGGTAGHVLPGLAIGRALVERGRRPEQIHFVGSTRGLEATLVPDAGFPLTMLAGRGVPRTVSPAALRAMGEIVAGVLGAVRLLRRLRPRVVIVLGGYASVPCTVAAVLGRVPIVVAEQNAKAGAANRLAGRFAKACAVPVGGADLPREVETGNPVREEIASLDRDRDRSAARRALGLPEDRVVVAVFSGSLGARTINRATIELARRWQGRGDVAIYHVVGRRDWDEVSAAAPATPGPGLVYRSTPYEDRMDLLLTAADVAVCRAGGTTVAELAGAGLPAVMAPLPIAPRDHQRANAAPLVDAGAGVLVLDSELDGARLDAELSALLGEPGRLATMGQAARTLARPRAADAVAALAEEHARR